VKANEIGSGLIQVPKQAISSYHMGGSSRQM